MINDVYFNLNKKIKKYYYKLENFENTDEVFMFLRIFQLYLQSDDECYKSYFIQSNPLILKSKDIEFMSKFNIQIEKFFDKIYNFEKKYNKNNSKKGDIACYLGVAYEYGLFNKLKDHSLAFHYYKISANLNNKFGTLKLATCYEIGLGTSINYDKAIYFYKRAGDLGLVDGMHIYGKILCYKLFNANKYIELGKQKLLLASFKADTIYPYPLFDLGQLLENKNNDEEIKTEKDYALEIYFKGAELGDHNCIFRLAQSYENGEISNEINLKKSYKLYKLAAEMGNTSAQLKVSELYYQGKFNKQNKPEFPKAFQWAVFAATKGHIRASYIVANHIKNGLGVKKNKLLALWWFTISNSYGYDKAEEKINELNIWIQNNNKGILKKIKNSEENDYCCFIF